MFKWLAPLKVKLVAFGVAAFSFVILLLKLKNNKIEKLEEENTAHVVKDELQESAKQTAIKAEAKESEDKKNFDDSDWRNNI